jgi:hypothetical protein
VRRIEAIKPLAHQPGMVGIAEESSQLAHFVLQTVP